VSIKLTREGTRSLVSRVLLAGRLCLDYIVEVGYSRIAMNTQLGENLKKRFESSNALERYHGELRVE